VGISQKDMPNELFFCFIAIFFFDLKVRERREKKTLPDPNLKDGTGEKEPMPSVFVRGK
jgi:hypothetical protein